MRKLCGGNTAMADDLAQETFLRFSQCGIQAMTEIVSMQMALLEQAPADAMDENPQKVIANAIPTESKPPSWFSPVPRFAPRM